MKVKIRMELMILYIILLCMTSFFGIIDINTDITLVISVIFILYVQINNIKIKVKYNYKYIILFSIILIIMSSIRSYQLYGQELILGIRAQRQFFILIMMYFPISKLLIIGKIKISDIQKMIYVIGIIQLTLFSMYYISEGSIKILEYNYDYRYNDMRLRVNGCIINALFVLSINNYINKKNKTMNLILIIANILVCAIILKTRLLIVSYIFVIIFAILMWKKDWIKKIFIGILIIFFTPLILNTNIVSDIISSSLKDNTSDLRTIGKAFYIRKLEESPLAGRGYINTQCLRAFVESGMNQQIYLVDNGIYGFTFVNGIIGLIWFFILWLLFFSESLRLYFKANNFIGILYLIHITILIPNIIWWYWSAEGGIMLILIISLIEFKSNEIRGEKHVEKNHIQAYSAKKI